MLKIVYPICCGMDVHKSFLVACIATTNEQGVTTYTSKRFSTLNPPFLFMDFPSAKPPRYVLSLKVFGARRYTKMLATTL